MVGYTLILMATFFAIFYVDDAYLASRDPDFLQRALDVLVDLFAQVGLETNVKKTQAMTCTPGRIRTQLPTATYQRMKRGLVTAEEWDSRKVQCRQCSKPMAASSLRRHLADQHEIYQEVVVAEEPLEARVAVTYRSIWNTAAGSPARFLDARVCCMEGGCFGDTLGTFTHSIGC